MFLFSGAREKQKQVQRLLVQIVNHHCDRLLALTDGPRGDERVSLTMPVQIVPAEGDQLFLDEAFPSITKEFSAEGLSIVVRESLVRPQVFLGIRWNEEMRWLRGDVRHQEALGAGFWVTGLRFTDQADLKQWPVLEQITV